MYGPMWNTWGTWGTSHHWFWLGGAPFLTLLSVGLIVVGLWLLFGEGWPRDHLRANRARDILDERYAAGELSTEEYRERREHLRQE